MKQMANMKRGMPMANPMQRAVSLLTEAVQLHKGHMNGSVPTSPESQQELMDLIEDALEAISPREAPKMEDELRAGIRKHRGMAA